MKAVQLQAFGNPADVVKLVDVPDLGAPGPDEVVIATEGGPFDHCWAIRLSATLTKHPRR